MVLIAKEMPEDKLIKDLQKALNDYSLNKNEENKKHLAFNVMLMSLRFSTENSSTGDALGKIDEFEKIHDHYKNITNKQ
jgi:hypothetical protein